METSFWVGRWHDNAIGWHQNEHNALLKKYWPQLKLEKDSSVLVPCCGKSSDMIYLAKQGHQVIGVELSEKACTDFFEENHISYELHTKPDHKEFVSENIRIHNGDLLAINKQQLPTINAIYDRAALIALTPLQRQLYSQKLIELSAPQQTKMLLISLEFDDSKKGPPPHNVTEKEIHTLFAAHYNITSLYRENVIDESEKFKNAGIEVVEETVFLLNFI